LLTVIAIIAMLATLLMTAIASAKKKSRTVVSTFNLRQISLALNMYLDDFGKRPPGIDELVSSGFLTEPRSLLCPEDKTGDWGRLVQAGGSIIVTAPSATPGPASLATPVKYSYLLHPLSWDEATWNRLMQVAGSAGVAACQLHGLGKQDVPDVHSFAGLLLRAQRDGAVVRRQLFWDRSLVYRGQTEDFFLAPNAVGGLGLLDQSWLQLYLDDPATWLQNKP